MNLIPKNCSPINLTSKAKIDGKNWTTRKPQHAYCQIDLPLMSESDVIIRNGELLVGVLDKQQYGATQYGLIHCIYEVNIVFYNFLNTFLHNTIFS